MVASHDSVGHVGLLIVRILSVLVPPLIRAAPVAALRLEGRHPADAPIGYMPAGERAFPSRRLSY